MLLKGRVPYRFKLKPRNEVWLMYNANVQRSVWRRSALEKQSGEGPSGPERTGMTCYASFRRVTILLASETYSFAASNSMTLLVR